jgi:hypothetical protein
MASLASALLVTMASLAYSALLGLSSLVGLVLGHINLIGLVGLICFISLVGLVSRGLNGLIGNGIILNSLQFKIEMKQSQHDLFERESWLWCVRRVFSSLAGLNSVFGHSLQNATQLLFDRIPQMNKYFITRECEHIGDTSISLQEGISIFEFTKRFLEISCRDLVNFCFSTTSII